MDRPPDPSLARTILPRKTPSDTPTADTASSSKTNPRLQSNTRINIRSACLACRRRRSKCSGGRPCNRCAALNTDCEYNETQDGRTRALRERGQEELESHKRILYGLFRAIREGSEQGLISLIRNNAPLSEIADAVEHHGIGTVSQGSNIFAAETQSLSTLTPAETMSVDGMDMSQTDFEAHTEFALQTSAFGHNEQMMGMLHTPSVNLELDNTIVDSNFQVETIQQLMEPLHVEDTGPTYQFSSLYVTFRDAARCLIQSGVPLDNIMDGPRVPCGLLWNVENLFLGVSTVAGVIVNQIHGLDDYFRLAWLCYITRYLRWAVQQSSACWEQIPAAMVLTHLQLTTSHIPFIDLVPLPQIRDRMIEENRDFITALRNAGATVEWPGDLNSAVEQDPSTGRLVVSARFEEHISSTNNFLFGRNFLHTFPELEGQLRIAAVGRIEPSLTLGGARPS